jgi:hypothetical protein
MTWKYSTDGMNGTYTINWSPSIYGTPYVNSVEKIVIGNFSFQDITFVYSSIWRQAYISAVVMDKQSLETYDIPTFSITYEFLYDMGVDCEGSIAKDDKFIEKVIMLLNKTGCWNGSSLKQNMKKKQIKKYNIKDLEYDPQTMYTHIFDPMATESNAKLKKELKEKDDLIAELNEQIQEMKEEIELLKAINQEC